MLTNAMQVEDAVIMGLIVIAGRFVQSVGRDCRYELGVRLEKIYGIVLKETEVGEDCAGFARLGRLVKSS
jgi:hypothetical protein